MGRLESRCYSYFFLILQMKARHREASKLPKAVYLVRVPIGSGAQIV